MQRSTNEEWWRQLLTQGHPMERVARRISPFLPAPPRCKVCYVPFGGIASKLLGLGGWRPSRKNPRLCAYCCERLPAGGAEVDVAVLFADVRGFTALAERLPPTEVAALMNRFYAMATEVLVSHDALIDKLVGDQVMALFLPAFAGQGYAGAAVHAGEALLRGAGYGKAGEQPWLRLGVGIHAGLAFVGNVGGSGILDFTALGDTVNMAERLQEEAAPGEIVVSEVVCSRAGLPCTHLETRTVTVRGKSEPFQTRVLRITLA